MSKAVKSSKANGKRPKNDNDDLQLLGGPEQDSNDGNDTASDTEEASAKQLFLAKYNKVSKRHEVSVKIVKTSGATVPTVAVEGVVVRTKTVMAPGRKGGQQVPKIETEIAVTRVRSNNAPDVLVTGVQGFEFLLPTKKPAVQDRDAADDSPEGGALNGGKKKIEAAPPRTLCLVEGHKTVWLGHFNRVSFYTTAAGGEQKDGYNLVVPGMPVEVTGVVANISDDGQALWLNAANCTPKLDFMAPGSQA